MGMLVPTAVKRTKGGAAAYCTHNLHILSNWHGEIIAAINIAAYRQVRKHIQTSKTSVEQVVNDGVFKNTNFEMRRVRGRIFSAYSSRTSNLHPKKSIEVINKYRSIERRIRNSVKQKDGARQSNRKTTGSGKASVE